MKSNLACLVDLTRNAAILPREFEGLGQFRSVYWYTGPYEAVKPRRRSTRRRIYGEGKSNRAAVQPPPSPSSPSYSRSFSSSSMKITRNRSDFFLFFKRKKFTTINWWNKFEMIFPFYISK